MLRTTIASFFLLFACAQNTAAANYDEVKRASPLQQFAMDPFKESQGYIPVFFNNKSELIERFGTPIKEESSKFPDRTSDAMLTNYYLQYDGLAFGIIEGEDKKHSWIEEFEITGNAYALKYELGIGSKRSDIVTLFEPKVYAKSNPMHLYGEVIGYWADYKDKSGQPKWVVADINVTFYFDATDRVERIVLGSYSD